MTAPVWSTVMVTGHRPQDIPDDAHGWVQDKLTAGAVWLRDERGMTTGITGMALGSDMWWADSLHRAGVPFVAHIPFPQQPDPWRKSNPRAVAEWHRLRALAASEVPYGDLAGLAEHARKRVMLSLLHKRNDGMLDATAEAGGAVVAVWRPSKRDGGTFSALKKAHQRDLPVILINPEALTVTTPDRARMSDLLYPNRPQPLIEA
ncbi:hypothetical protein MED01_002360 [Micromonospora sp. MED01]|uniref:hypothetical protein n=1 Tax=Micromonospora alfalfae TaxID=2911212 RepID=UPI001EE7C36D|nr:hypothetical protein [Micromonospora alfalfae]MCG5464195.1 hypothetical protein [Micromonospora alfalfae]